MSSICTGLLVGLFLLGIIVWFFEIVLSLRDVRVTVDEAVS